MAWAAAPRRVILFFLQCLLLAAPASEAQQRVRVGIYENSPKVGLDATGKPQGIFVDIVEAIAAREGWQLDYVAGTWGEGLTRLGAGQIDLMPDVARTPEREKIYAFPREAVLTNWNQLYVKRGSGIRTLLDLKDRRVAVLEETIQQEQLARMAAGFDLNVSITPLPDYATAFRAVAEGKFDAVTTNRFYGLRHAAAAGLEDTAILFNPTQQYFASPKSGNPALLAAVDRHLADYKKDPASVYFRSLNRWVNEETHFAVPQWLTFAAIAGVALLVAAAVWLILLRRVVAARTADLQHRNRQIAVVNQSLRESEQKYRELVENANSIILRWTHDGQIAFMNEFGQRFFGYAEDELRGRNVIGTIAPETESGGRDLKLLMDEICRNPARFEQNVNENIRRNGERVWIAWTNKIALDQEGRVAEILSIGTDITARKQMEEELRVIQASLEQRVALRTQELAEREALAQRLAEERELLLENIQVGVLFTGDGRILNANPKFAEIFGYDSPAELVGAETGVLFPGAEDYRKFSAEAAAVLTAHRVLDIDWHGRRRDGGVFVGHTIARAIAAPGYRFAAIWMVEDITARRAAEREVAELTTFLQSIIDHVTNPIFYKGPDLRFRGCNNAYEQAFGVTRADFIGKTVLDLSYLPLADREAYQAEDAAVTAAGTTVQREAVIPFADGLEHQTLYSVSGFRGPDGAPAGLVGVVVDITPLKETEAALAEAKDFLNAIVDHIPNPLFYKDAELRFVGCNRANEEAFGVKREDLIGKTVLEVNYLPEAERRIFHEEQARLLSEGGTLRREVAMPFADGKLHQLLHSSRAFRRADGSPGGLVGVLVDITPLKETEAALAEAKQAAEAADRIKSAFLATMSHELRTPLNSIIGFTGIVLQELAGPLNAEQHKQLGMVRDSARHLLALINDVLDISKIEAGELTVAAEAFDPAASIAKVAAIVGPLAEKKGLALSVRVADDLGVMVSDARRCEQILLNLLGNAIKFTESGAVALDAELLVAFRLAGGTPGPAIRVRIADTGIGIKPDDMAVLFTPFRQVDSALSRSHEGTGLGLAICRRLATLMGGIIEAESRWQQGSVFTVTLPLRSPAAREPS